MWLAVLGLALVEPASDTRLEAFVEACVPHRRDVDRAAEALAAAGWVRVGEDDHPELAATMAVGRRELAGDPDFQPTLSYSFWRRELEGRPIHVVLNRVDLVLQAEDEDSDGDGEIQEWEKADTLTLLGCGLWDFDAPAPVPEAAVTAWAGAEPVQRIASPGGMSGATWNVHARLPGTGEVHVGWLPEGADAARTGFTGVAISMTSAPEDDAD